MDEKVIAQKYLDACATRENSWDVKAEKYCDNRRVTDILRESLTKEEAKTGFAQMLLGFGGNWSNDCIDICTGLGAVTSFIDHYPKEEAK